MTWRWGVIGVLSALMLSACAARLAERYDLAPRLARHSGWAWGHVSAGAFDLAAAWSAPTGTVLTVYLEGDGLAFDRNRHPSADPTPTDPVALRLAMAQPGDGPVAWLGRPCQYALASHGRNCHMLYWTNARYAPEVLASVGDALDQLKRRANASRLVLVGYSGGGALAVLLAAQRADIDGIITVVADLDLNYWTERDHLTPLFGSVDPTSQAAALGHLPQYHLTGAQDKVVGTDVAASFMHYLPVGTPAWTREIPGFTHACCWVDAWPSLYRDAARRIGLNKQVNQGLE